MRPNILTPDFPMPRGLRAVRAEAPKKPPTVDDLAVAWEAFRDRQITRIDALEAEVDRQVVAGLGVRLNGGGGAAVAPDPEYTGIFAGYMRGGGDAEAMVKAANAPGGSRYAIQAAMSSGSSADGGYVAPVEWDRRILQAQRIVSPMRRLATVMPTSTGAFTSLWSNDAWGSGWVGETASRPATGTPTLLPILFKAGEIYANPGVTQTLLDDSAFDLEQWLADSVSAEFSRQEGIAFISGDGINKPFGLLQYVAGGAAAAQHPGGVLDVTASGHASQIQPDALIGLVYALPSSYRQNAAWLMNSATAAAIRLLKDGQANYLWAESYVAGQPPTLLGYRVEIDENMPNIAANSLPIAFGDFRVGYLINDRMGVRVLRDPYMAKPYVQFYCTKRVGAGVQNPKAIRLLKISAT